jgi:glycosyltransferase involved in cell wall biosynthesis
MNGKILNIWHIGGDSSVDCVNGVNTVVWIVARSQARLGHAVTVVLPSEPDHASVQIAQDEALKLFVAPKSKLPVLGKLSALLKTDKPDIVHMHSVFVPQQSALASALTARRIPYIITPHGGLSEVVMNRGRLKKVAYRFLFERKRFARAAAVTVSNPSEILDVQRFVPGCVESAQVVFNPVDVPEQPERVAPAAGARPQILFLGRLDVEHKGIDRLVEIARNHPEGDYHLYGSEDSKTRAWLNKIKQNLPANVYFHPPVYGQDKFATLNAADFYVQASRWEGFPLSVAEAMEFAVPCAISETLGMTELFRSTRLALILEKDPARAAEDIRTLLADRDAVVALGQRGQAFARQNFLPSAVATHYLDVYRQAIQPTDPATSHAPPATLATSIAGGT